MNYMRIVSARLGPKNLAIFTKFFNRSKLRYEPKNGEFPIFYLTVATWLVLTNFSSYVVWPIVRLYVGGKRTRSSVNPSKISPAFIQQRSWKIKQKLS